jgi:quercetin dioxygenase-like cupin family protein
MDKIPNTQFLAQILIPTSNLTEEMNFFHSLGFRLDNIFPDDDPNVAIMSGHNLQLCIDKQAEVHPATIQLRTDDVELLNQKAPLHAPNGTHIQFVPNSYHLQTPKTEHKFEVRQLRDKEPWVIGRAGMMYRDLIPGRLGGGIMASHIRIPNGGPVPDMVHYHTIGFQLIFCYKGWVRLVYEDQGPEFILNAGDCVTQPPEIRHRVLEASDNLEVIEIGVPAEHMTSIDHEMDLPTNHFRPKREFHGQTFCHHKLKEANWKPWRKEHFQYRDTGIKEATKGIASVHVVKAEIENANSGQLSHSADILFRFLMKGQLAMEVENEKPVTLKQGDAFVIPPKVNYEIKSCTMDTTFLEVQIF